MKTSPTSLLAPIGIILFLTLLLLLLLFLPDPLRLPQPSPLAHNAPLIIRHAPVPVVRHVRDVTHSPPRP